LICACQGKNERKSGALPGKDSARPVLRPFGSAKAVYILSRRIYEHVEFIVNAEQANAVVFTQTSTIGNVNEYITDTKKAALAAFLRMRKLSR